ncbi:hypothetical protein ACUHMQ_14705 [Chitinimonas sp. PSY-7]|uniref:hypothetical protein n=1 Tax=Chitinimonas sp. PSY-7 TaxID=3459088 RepID=UPI00403FE89C
MKPRHMVMTGLLIVAAYLAFWGDKAAPTANAATFKQSARKPADAAPVRKPVTENTQIAALLPRASLMHEEEDEANLFPAKSKPKAAAAVAPPAPAVVSPPPAQVAPPLPFQFIGKQFDGQSWEVYLESADQTLVVHIGDTLLGAYWVDEIKPTLLTLTFLPLEAKQTLAIGQGEE